MARRNIGGRPMKKLEVIKVHNLDIEFTKPISCRNYQEAEDNCSKYFRLPEIWELIKIYLHYDYSGGGVSILETYRKNDFLFFYTNARRHMGIHNGKIYWFLRKTESEGETFSVHLDSTLTYSNDNDDTGGTVIYIKKNKKELKLEEIDDVNVGTDESEVRT